MHLDIKCADQLRAWISVMLWEHKLEMMVNADSEARSIQTSLRPSTFDCFDGIWTMIARKQSESRTSIYSTSFVIKTTDKNKSNIQLIGGLIVLNGNPQIFRGQNNLVTQFIWILDFDLSVSIFQIQKPQLVSQMLQYSLPFN